MKYLRSEDIIYINETQVGPGMVRDRGLLDAAVERPKMTVGGEDAYPDIHTKAAALTQSLVKNHPFVDGNKRTATLSDIAFYGINGYAFQAPEADLIHFVIDVATSELSEVDDIGRQLSQWVHALPET